MALTTGTRVGPYEILSAIGAGGMGEVYRARDSRLNRDVALKVLPELFAADPERVARFKREAQVLASLNHPHIAAIYGFEDNALVLELVEGPTLADRIAQGPIPLDEAIPIARQIADALDAAHEQGIIHRDLKPANVKLRPDGTVKVLDFGLAKALEPSAVGAGFSRPDPSMSPTITSPAATGIGMILGTAAYMSPEQARGKQVDKRSDIWAFGCVLYEMLTGHRPFEGEDITEVLARIIEREPDLATLPASTPTPIRRLLRRCLEKDRRKRLPDIGVARIEIDEALSTPAEREATTAPPARPRSIGQRLLWPGALVVAVAVTAAATWFMRPRAESASETRLQIVTPPPQPTFNNLGFASFALSPDGRSVVFQALRDGRGRLSIRPLNSDISRVLPGTEDAINPFWSPNGRSLGFFVNGKLRTLDIGGGQAETIADAPTAVGGTWGRDGTILFGPSTTGPIYRVPAGGGMPTAVTKLEAPAHVGHRFPRFLPDGRRFIFFVVGLPAVQGIYAGSLDSTETRRIVLSDGSPGLLAPDTLLFVRNRALFAQTVDPASLEPGGDARRITDGLLEIADVFGNVPVSIGAETIAYRRGDSQRELAWVDRRGSRISIVSAADSGLPIWARLSPDGRTVAMDRITEGNDDLWLLDVERGFLRRLTSVPTNDSTPVWSPDGTRVAFSSRQKGPPDIYQVPISGNAPATPLFESSENKYTLDWSPDGRHVLFYAETSTGRDVWAVETTGDHKTFPVLNSRFNETGARFSPDGRWILYVSDDTGSDEIYVRAYAGAGVSGMRISPAGGSFPDWRRDGREIFYISGDNQLMAAPVSWNQSVPEIGTPAALFALRPSAEFMPDRNGQRFLIGAPTEESAVVPITVLTHWK